MVFTQFSQHARDKSFNIKWVKLEKTMVFVFLNMLETNFNIDIVTMKKRCIFFNVFCNSGAKSRFKKRLKHCNLQRFLLLPRKQRYLWCFLTSDTQNWAKTLVFTMLCNNQATLSQHNMPGIYLEKQYDRLLRNTGIYSVLKKKPCTKHRKHRKHQRIQI